MQLPLNSWSDFFEEEAQKEYFQILKNQVLKAYATKEVYPLQSDIFRCFELTPLSKLKVVILGQDPYHQPGQAMGLSFSVTKGTKIPPSLRNIFKELEADLGLKPASGDLTPWANQGVLLLNSCLTVERSLPNSHQDYGWEYFVDNLITYLNQKGPLVYILWGNYAKSKKSLLTKKDYVIEASHPSPLSASRGFFGSKPFSKTNKILKTLGKGIIDWSIEDVL